MKKTRKFRASPLIGRDPTFGRVQGRAGVHLSRKNKMADRNSKYARRQRRECDIEYD